MKKILISIFCAFLSFCSVSAQDYSKRVDDVLNKSYKELRVTPNRFVTDDEFVRRAYVTIIGRIPTYDEYAKFSAIADQNKRTKLISYLVNHPGYVSHQFNMWADTLRLREKLNTLNNFNGGPYVDYVKDTIAANKPYDKFVSEMLLSSGNYYKAPATGYYYRDLGMPLDNLIGTAKIFLGTDISCAQCHDDPFQDFSQLQFYQMAATFAQLELRPKVDPIFRDKHKALRDRIDELIKADPMKNRGINNQINNFIRSAQSDVEIVPTKVLRLPHDYQYPDAKPGDIVVPRVLNGSNTVNTSGDMRADAVKWMLSSHPTFTKNIVNRYWKQVFGMYIIDNYDNIQDDPRLDGELMNTLSSIFVDLNYDVKRFLSVLYHTQLFQRATYDGSNFNSPNFTFIGPVKQRLSAEQLWDSSLSLYMEKPEYFNTDFHIEYVNIMNVTADDLELNRMQKKLELYQQNMRSKFDKAQKYKNLVLVRASEINDGTTSNTVLQQLGRSDRELIQTSSLEGSVTQVISFMNGLMSDMITDKSNYLSKNINLKSPADKIEIIFKSILSRSPTIQEKSLFAGVQDDDLIWALVNTNEFKYTK